MLTTMTLLPGIELRCYPDHRFKQGALSIQLVRHMCAQEAAMNALLPAVLLRGCAAYPDLRDITWRLDELYGSSVGTLVRRIGDYQTTGLYCGFMEDRFAMPGDEILAPVTQLLRQLLLEPVLEDGAFRRDYVESEKKNLIATIESQRNDKRAYAIEQMMRHMSGGDSFGLPRLGEKEQVAEITPRGLTGHYRKILRESLVQVFYVGSAPAEAVAALIKPLFAGIERDYVNLPAQSPFLSGESGDHTEEMEIAQGKLAMGFVSPTTIRDEEFVAMQVFNLIFGGGMVSKLFMQIREKMSLCYDIGSGFHGTKGILSVSAGIDSRNESLVRQEILNQLDACCCGRITDEELGSAKEALCSSLRATHDSPGSIENYYATAALSGLKLTPARYMQAVEATTREQVCQAAKSLKLHTVFFLKGVSR